MSQRAVIYARYSSDLQSDASIEDQIRLCTEKAQTEGWKITNCYTDAGISGASLMRHGIQGLLSAAMNGEFDILLAEALDRLSRDQEDIAGIYKRMEFAGVKIITLSEGEISSLHIGLKGTMNAMFLKDLADKTRRGLRGRVEKGKSGGGIAYGYKVVKQFDVNGEAIRGNREIDEDQAEIVRRIFQKYGHENKSPKAIAAQLNKEGIPCPSGNAWGQSTINGNRKRGTGILNNDLYRGELVWNRQKFIKNPSTGKRVTRMNPESEWIRKNVPELRIVDQGLWDAVRARQSALNRKKSALWRTNRPQYLLSGLLKCGCCGGGYAKMNATHYGCSSSKNKGLSVCANRRAIKRETLEGFVLDALRTHLMRDDLVDIFCKEYTKHMNTLISAQNSDVRRYRREKTKVAKEKANIIQAIKDGVPADMIKDELETISERAQELEAKLAAAGTEPRPFIHPAMAGRYRAQVKALCHALSERDDGESREHVRSLIEKIVLTPKEGKNGLQIDLHGDLAGILSIAQEKRDMGELKRLRLLSANDNKPEALVDSVGSGGRI